MFRKSSLLCAVCILFLLSSSTHAGLIKNAGKASTSNTTTTTSGQHSILMTVDPFNITSFQLDVSFEAEKVQLVSITGLNGFVIDDDFSVLTDGNTGLIQNIHGYFPGYDDRFTPINTDGPAPSALPGLPLPPAGEVDIFQLEFLVLDPYSDKTFGVFASPTDYINGIDPDTGDDTQASGPINTDGFGVAPAFSTVPGLPRDGGNNAPLPGALAMGLLGGAGVLAKAARGRKA
jgi:hypothetical protein